jgi:CheY-like chemotaxis protein
MRVPSKSILLVEDDLVDALTVRRALKELHITNPLEHVENGEDALSFLRDPVKDYPCIILLDLNMPVMNGIEFLQLAKTDQSLKRIPVIVLTTSEEQEDIIESFIFGVAGYMRKPVDYRQFVETIRCIDLYWTMSELPE